MLYLFLAISVVGFVWGLRVSNLASKARQALGILSEAVQVMRSSTISDAEKERRVQAAATQSLKMFLTATTRAVAVLLLPLLLVTAGAWLNLYAIDQAISAASDWKFIVSSGALATLALRW